jgi:hypothetical protein
MWLPSLIHKLNINDMQSKGLNLNANDIYSINNSSLKDAVVALDRGSCTAELISSNGLLLTNHHCGYDEIQNHSSVENNYLEEGFWAMSYKEELPNPGKSVTFLISIEDVTDKVLAQVRNDMDEEERSKIISSVTSELEKEAKKDTHYETFVRSFFNANQFHLFVTETFNDVRLVGAPPQALGKFGGDTDNWMWPRHSNDFSLFRVYCGPDGNPANFSEDNIPYKPRHFFPVSIKGIREGDFTMVMGYPGHTNRYITSHDVKYIMEVTNPVRVEVRDAKLQILDEYMSTGPKAKIQYAAKYAQSSNYFKYSIGQNNGLNNLNVIERKKALENEFTNWVNNDESRKDKYGQALTYIANSYSMTDANKAQEYIAEAMIRGPEIFSFAYRALPLFRLLNEKDIKDDFLDMITSRVSSGMNSHFKDYDAETDQKVAGTLLKLYADNNSPAYYPEFFNIVNKKYKGDFMKYTEKMFKKSVFVKEAELTSFLENPNMKTLNKDMAFQAAQDIFKKFRDIDAMVEEKNEQLITGHRLFLSGLMEMQDDKKFYPDANSTMRLTYGQILPYKPEDGVIFKYYTTHNGYLEKEIPGDDEFNVPERLKELFINKDFGRYADDEGNLPACFISNNDITGGNSGSPVLNANGELIGIAFDGNWEAMSGDIAFEPELQRCINVDIRFVLWVIDKYAGATHLIDEMTVIE